MNIPRNEYFDMNFQHRENKIQGLWKTNSHGIKRLSSEAAELFHQ